MTDDEMRVAIARHFGAPTHVHRLPFYGLDEMHLAINTLNDDEVNKWNTKGE